MDDDFADAGDTGSGPSTSPIRVVLLCLLLASIWGVYAMSNNASTSSPSLPLGPVGQYDCSQAVREAKSYVPDAIDEAQSGVDQVIAENPELAPYAAEAKEIIRDSAPDVYSNLDAAGDELGC